jgi:hypothetical protein
MQSDDLQRPLREVGTQKFSALLLKTLKTKGNYPLLVVTPFVCILVEKFVPLVFGNQIAPTSFLENCLNNELLHNVCLSI